MELNSETELLVRLAEGDENALTCIYQKYWQSLFIAAYNVLKDKKASEDIVQEIFLQLWLKRSSLQIKASLKAYLLAATRYQVFRAIKKASVNQGLPAHLVEKAAQFSVEDTLLQKDLKRQVDSVVAVLPKKCRQIYQMSREEELSHKEISERLNISTKTVENQLTIALRRLRHSLEGFTFLCFFLWALLCY